MKVLVSQLTLQFWPHQLTNIPVLAGQFDIFRSHPRDQENSYIPLVHVYSPWCVLSIMKAICTSGATLKIDECSWVGWVGGVRWLSGEGVGLVIRRLLVRFPDRAKWRCVLGQDASPYLPQGECPCTYCKWLWIRASAKCKCSCYLSGSGEDARAQQPGCRSKRTSWRSRSRCLGPTRNSYNWTR